MKIEAKTLVAVASALLARIDARRAEHLDASDCAFEAVGMLRAFVEGYREEETTQVRQYEALAHIPDEDEDPF